MTTFGCKKEATHVGPLHRWLFEHHPQEVKLTRSTFLSHAGIVALWMSALACPDRNITTILFVHKIQMF